MAARLGPAAWWCMPAKSSSASPGWSAPGVLELAQLIFGVRKATAGVIEIDGEPVVIHSPREAIDLGIGFLTENRKEQGLFLELAAQENITMATLERDATWGCSTAGRRKAISDDAIQLLNIRVPARPVRAGGLSGGNQQKLLNFALGGDWPAHSNPR